MWTPRAPRCFIHACCREIERARTRVSGKKNRRPFLCSTSRSRHRHFIFIDAGQHYSTLTVGTELGQMGIGHAAIRYSQRGRYMHDAARCSPLTLRMKRALLLLTQSPSGSSLRVYGENRQHALSRDFVPEDADFAFITTFAADISLLQA